MIKRRWYHFFWFGGRRWSAGITNFGSHLSTPLLGIGIEKSTWPPKFQYFAIGFWPRIPLEDGGQLYKWNWALPKRRTV